MKACSRHIPTVNIPFFHASAQPPSAGEAHEGWDSTVWTIFANPSRVARLSKFPWKFGYDETALCVPPNIIFGSRRFVFAEDLENLRHGWAPLSSDVRQVLKGRTLEDSWDLDPEFLLNSCGAHPDEQMGVWDVYFPHQMGSKVVPTVFFFFVNQKWHFLIFWTSKSLITWVPLENDVAPKKPPKLPGCLVGAICQVGRVGEGEAASLAALNAIACLRKGVCMQPLPDAWFLAGGG